MNNHHDTYGERLAKYERRVSMATWVGTGVVVLVACLAAGALKPGSLSSTWVFTFVLVGGFLLAFVRVKFDWAGTQIERKIKSRQVQKTDPMPENDPWPKGPDNLWFLSLFLIFFGGVTMLVGIWGRYLEVGDMDGAGQRPACCISTTEAAAKD